MKLNSTNIVVACAVLAHSCLAGAVTQIYKVVQADGTVLFTDTPVSNAESFELKGNTNNTASALVVPSPPTSADKNKSQKTVVNYTIAIVTPSHEQTFRDPQGRVTIQAQATPPNKQLNYQLWLGGELTQANKNGIFQLQGLDRGAHNYYISLTDNSGKTLASSEQQTLFMHKPSVLFRQN